MIRGTTPTHTFKIPFDTSLIDEVRVIYAQDDNVMFIKSNDECTLENDTIVVKLSQEDTFKFDHARPVQIQLRVLTVAGQALASIIKQVGINDCLDEEVLQ